MPPAMERATGPGFLLCRGHFFGFAFSQVPPMDSIGLPHWLILASILLASAGFTGLAIDRKKLGKVDEGPANEASSVARPQLPPIPELLDSRPRRERRQAATDGDLKTKPKRVKRYLETRRVNDDEANLWGLDLH